ncbi:MAG TPA: serine/threonine-protein kinase [Ktedonobacteraceae bacterium]
MATTLYSARTEELWLPPEVFIRLLPPPEIFTARGRVWFFQRFEREARSLIQLRHPALFPLFGYGEFDGMAYLLFPNMPAGTLAERLQSQRRWSPADAFAFLAPVADALDTLHQHGLIYQFLNPAWILLPENQPPQLANARLAQMVSCQGFEASSEHTSRLPVHLQALDGSPLGAPGYLAPEVVKGAEADARSDVYALGALLFEMLCGQPLFRGADYLTTARRTLLETPPSLHELVPALPVALDIVLNRALHHDPRARFQSAGELMASCFTVLHSRVHLSNASLLTSLQAQRKTLPQLTPSSQSGSVALPVTPLPEMLSENEAFPSSPEELMADAWLNTPISPAAAGSAPLPAVDGQDAESQPHAQPNVTARIARVPARKGGAEPISEPGWPIVGRQEQDTDQLSLSYLASEPEQQIKRAASPRWQEVSDLSTFF